MNDAETLYLKSMTAFGRGISDFVYGRLIVEIQSVNRRYLEMNISLPRQFNHFEIEIRKKLSASLGRGTINFSLNWQKDESRPLTVIPNLALAKGLNEAWKKLAHELGLMAALPLELLTQEKELFLYKEMGADEEIYRLALFDALEKAMLSLDQMKKREGQSLAFDLKSRLHNLNFLMDEVALGAQDAPEKYRKKLIARLEEIFKGNFEQHERIFHEVAIYAEKIDITEEITRFKSHLKQFLQLLNKPFENPTESRGKLLDFLLQELNRECNTIGSKSADIEIIQRVLAIKGELEKIREQVQNIE